MGRRECGLDCGAFAIGTDPASRTLAGIMGKNSRFSIEVLFVIVRTGALNATEQAFWWSAIRLWYVRIFFLRDNLLLCISDAWVGN